MPEEWSDSDSTHSSSSSASEAEAGGSRDDPWVKTCIAAVECAIIARATTLTKRISGYLSVGHRLLEQSYSSSCRRYRKQSGPPCLSTQPSSVLSGTRSGRKGAAC